MNDFRGFTMGGVLKLNPSSLFLKSKRRARRPPIATVLSAPYYHRGGVGGVSRARAVFGLCLKKMCVECV